MESIGRYLGSMKALIDRALGRSLPPETGQPHAVHRAMRYAVFSGGKRIRPILTLESCAACGGRIRTAIPIACAIELIHTYSLVHDDLPAMDDDDYRRGKPAVHKKFDEATAILAGDALLTSAFSILASSLKPALASRVIAEISSAVGTAGMIGGQAADMAAKGKQIPRGERASINARKTGRLIAVSCKVGAIASGVSREKIATMERFGRLIGLLFQITDDIIDREAYIRSMGIDRARRAARRYAGRAVKTLSVFGKRGRRLAAVTDQILQRTI